MKGEMAFREAYHKHLCVVWRDKPYSECPDCTRFAFKIGEGPHGLWQAALAHAAEIEKEQT